MRNTLKDKKGMTIIEIIVSLVLISLVMVFMYQLLADIKFESKSSYFAIDNQEQRIEIIKAAENLNWEADTVVMNNYMSNSHKELRIVDDSTITIKNGLEVKTWKLDNITLNNSLNVKCLKWNDIRQKYDNIDFSSANSGDTCYVSIEVYTDNNENSNGNNNIIDDITFSIKKA